MKKFYVLACLILGLSLALGACSKQDEKAEQKAPVTGKAEDSSTMTAESLKESAQTAIETGKEMLEEKAVAIKEQVVETAKEVTEQVKEKTEEIITEKIPEQYQGAVETVNEVGKSFMDQPKEISTIERQPNPPAPEMPPEMPKLPSFK